MVESLEWGRGFNPSNYRPSSSKQSISGLNKALRGVDPQEVETQYELFAEKSAELTGLYEELVETKLEGLNGEEEEEEEDTEEEEDDGL